MRSSWARRRGQVSGSFFAKWRVARAEQFIGRSGIPHIVFLQHNELIAVEWGRFFEHALEKEFQKRGLGARQDKRHAHLESLLAHQGKNVIHELGHGERLRAAQIIALADRFGFAESSYESPGHRLHRNGLKSRAAAA